ncbi:DUF3164 family protein [Sagittula sp. S175]|uniref:DUF3164 family protein n=1 Tax=Sagittula sp. S175 TaxID=3415129 RepID=UPI003C7DB870
MNEQTTQAWQSGIIEQGGQRYMADSQGRLTPVELVKAEDQLQDDLVRKVIHFADELSAQITRFKGHSFEDVQDFLAILRQEYDQTRGGTEGNMTFLSYDGTLKVTVQVAKHYDYGPELQVARELVDECLKEWSAGTRAEIRAIITKAFNTDNEGKINRDDLLSLTRLDIEDERWQRAMRAIKAAERAIGSKKYMRFHRRENAKAQWQAITVDMAKA